MITENLKGIGPFNIERHLHLKKKNLGLEIALNFSFDNVIVNGI